MTTLEGESRRGLWVGDRYLGFLAIVLLGYAVMGKGFAYLGVPPLYVGEIAFVLGIIVLFRSGALVGMLATLPAVLLVVLMILVLARTLPYVSVNGIDALRDSAIVMYGGFAFIVAGLLLEDARRITLVLRHYRIMLASLPALFIAVLLTKYWWEHLPRLFGPTPIVEVGPSPAATHLAGAMIFVLIGYGRASVAWLLLWVATFAISGATNRGAMLSVVVPVALAILVLKGFRFTLALLVGATAILVALLAVESAFGEYTEAKESIDRPISAHQLVQNALSIAGQSGSQSEGTKRWRLQWWDIIINDTIGGPNFWTGRGFGINLADADGFAGTGDHPRPPTRSPHSAHMTLLARAGVPGLVLWVLVLLSWFVMLTRAMLGARIRGHKQWADLFLFIGCYGLAIVINGSFDVALESPMQGVWFWCLFGFGTGSVMIYRAQVASECAR
jgi:hypothetical protein